MAEEDDLEESMREDVRDRIRSRVLGELRLKKWDRETIEQGCFESYVLDDCPEEEHEEFRRFVADEIGRVTVRLEAEEADWPAVTDCDRLDRVEAALRERGILLWQASPCCDSCTGGELWDRVEQIDKRFPGFLQHVRGYAFFIDQNLPEDLAESEQVTVWLAYGAFIAQDSADGDFKQEGLQIAREVSDCLQQEGLEPDWDGTTMRKIGVTVEWRRRGMLE